MKLVVERLNKTYKTNVENLNILQDVSFTLKSGEWMTIIGPSGSGKSTLLKCIAGIENSDQESYIQLGESVLNEMPSEEVLNLRRNNIGFIYQDYKLFDQFDALTNVMLPLMPYEKKDLLDEKGKELLKKVGLSERIHHMPSQLSGGEKQRVAIARSLINDPDLLICDEPTGSLDENNRDQIIEILKHLNVNGKSILLVTHDKDIISEGQKVMLLRHGNLREQHVIGIR